MTFYSLWDTEAGNSLGTFASEDEALAVISSVLEINGDDLAQALELGRHEGEEEHLVATGPTLIERVQAWRRQQLAFQVVST